MIRVDPCAQGAPWWIEGLRTASEKAILRLSAFHVLLLAAACVLAPAWAIAQPSGISAKLHPWGAFNPGAWKTVRVITETLKEHDQVVSTSMTDTKTTLVDLDNDGVTLEIEPCIEVAGKRFEAEPQTVKQGFHGETVGPSLTVRQPVDGEVTIEGQKIPCKVEKLESVVSNGKTVITIYYSTTVAPYIL